MPEHNSTAKSALDVINLESLTTQLEYKARKELTLEDAVPEDTKARARDLARIIGGHKPKMNFMLKLDRETLNIVNLIEPTSKIALDLERLIRGKLDEIKLGMPAIIRDELEFFTSGPMNWNETKEFSRKRGLKHGLRFLVVSWYDGKEYKQKIMSTMIEMEKLERNHKEDIYFLEETNKRCFYSNYEYYYDPYSILEDAPSSLLNILDPYQLLEDAFWCYFWEEQELTRLEAALISGGASAKLSKEMMKEKWKLGENEIRSPYPILSAKAYVRMKLPFLDDDEKKFLIKDLLQYLETTGDLYSPDYRLHPKDYQLAIDLLLEKLNINDDTKKQVKIRSPIMNFQFFDKKRKIDLTGQSLVKSFYMFMKDPKKTKWLQKCLSLGLPTFPYIPFDKLGFKSKNIL